MRLSDERIRAAAHTAIAEKQVPHDLRAFRKLGEELGELLDIPLSFHTLESRLARVKKMLRNFWAITFLGFVAYIVLGGIATGHSVLMGDTRPVLSFGVLILLLLGLFALEGLQISVTTLRLKDFRGFQRTYPQAVALHRRFRDPSSNSKFLAGRQLLVIVIVFLAARLTSFPDLATWPFTSTPFPSWLSPWFKVVLGLGIPGALFVLWLGQLLPQFVANRHPIAFLNLPGMGLVLALSFFVESLGLTRAGNWLSQLGGEGPDIPVSPVEKYRQETDVIHGYGITGLKKTWELWPDKAILEYQNSVAFSRSGFHRIIDRSLVIGGGSVRPAFNYELLCGPGTLSGRQVYAERPEEERLSSEWRRLKQTLKPNWGAFQAGDVVCTRSTVVCPRAEADQIVISAPTQYVLFRIRFAGNPSSIGRITIRGYKVDEFLANPAPFLDQDLPLYVGEDKVPFAEFLELYPEINSTYIFEWDVQY